MRAVTSPRRLTRERARLLPVGGSLLLVAGTADAAVTTPILLEGVAGNGLQSAP